MAKSIVARRKGDTYQARFYWLKLLKLRTDDYIESVTFENDEVPFVDDVVVSYCQPITDRLTGNRVVRDLFQCKYHMTGNGAFTYENLIDPRFINSKDSMLTRLYNAYVYLSRTLCAHTFRLYIVSNWYWDYRDVVAVHMHEGLIRSTFYEEGENSRTGKVRSRLANYLSISEDEFRCFLNCVRFALGKGLEALLSEMQPRLQLAGLQPIDVTKAECVYDSLAWQLFEQGRHVFNKQSLNQMIREEKLIALESKKHSEVSIRSFAQRARRPIDLQVCHLDLCDLFDNRLAKDDGYWRKEIPELVSSFMLNEDLGDLARPIHLFFDCHLSIAFFAGHLISPKHRIEIVPTQMSGGDYRLWSSDAPDTSDQLWDFETAKTIGNEVVLGISVTHDVRLRLQACLQDEELTELSQILVFPTQGVSHSAVSGGNHAWQLGSQLAKQLRDMLPATCHMIHLFYAGPVALAYILGHKLRYVTESVQLYELRF